MKKTENFFLKSLSEKEAIFSDLRRSHSNWKNELQSMQKPFFAIHSDFKDQFLKDISGGALKLYLYLGFHAKYQTGELWHTTEEISLFFGKDQRTIGTWFKELEDMGLIFREQKGFKMKSNTFLRPYGIIFDGPKIVLDDEESENYKAVIQDVEESVALGWKLTYVILFNNFFTEYTVVLLYKENNIFHGSYFVNFPENQIRNLRVSLKKYGAKTDNYDIDAGLATLRNKDALIYKYLKKYLEENGVALK